MAAGDAGPTGPVAQRAKAEATRLLRLPETRATLASNPQSLGELRPMLLETGLAA
jgi:hypothetical protein